MRFIYIRDEKLRFVQPCQGDFYLFNGEKISRMSSSQPEIVAFYFDQKIMLDYTFTLIFNIEFSIWTQAG